MPAIDPFFAIGICALLILLAVTVVRSFKSDLKCQATAPIPAQDSRNVRSGPDLSLETLRRIDILFPREDDRVLVRKLLYDRIGNNLLWGGQPDVDPDSADRLRFAALKCSKGSLPQLEKAIKLAAEDWRDLLCAAGFASNPEKHRRWEPKPPKPSTRPLTP